MTMTEHDLSKHADRAESGRQRPKRRTFTAEYKLSILEQADACSERGEIGELLRREGLYKSALRDFA